MVKSEVLLVDKEMNVIKCSCICEGRCAHVRGINIYDLGIFLKKRFDIEISTVFGTNCATCLQLRPSNYLNSMIQVSKNRKSKLSHNWKLFFACVYTDHVTILTCMYRRRMKMMMNKMEKTKIQITNRLRSVCYLLCSELKTFVKLSIF